MLKSKVKVIAMTFIIFVISIFFMNTKFAKNLSENDDEITDWKVAITSDAKDLNNTQKIDFKVQDNKNVLNGKIAPGVNAIATIEIDLTGTKVPVDISFSVDKSSLYPPMKLKARLDDEVCNENEIHTVKLKNNKEFTNVNGKKIMTLELEWDNDDSNNEVDTAIGSKETIITVPITIDVKQHI